MQGAITAHTSVCVCPLPPETRKYYKVSSPYARKGKLATSRSCIILIALKYHTRPVNIPVLLQRLILLFAFTLVDYISLKLEGSCCTPTQNLIIFGYPPGNPDACLPRYKQAETRSGDHTAGQLGLHLSTPCPPRGDIRHRGRHAAAPSRRAARNRVIEATQYVHQSSQACTSLHLRCPRARHQVGCSGFFATNVTLLMLPVQI